METTNTNNAEQRRPLPGFRFFPTDLELILTYLRPKTFNLPLPPSTGSFIATVDIYKHPPWLLPLLSPIAGGETDWYFFATVKGGERKRRRTEEGFWKSCCFDTPVFEGKRKVGMKKRLVYYSGQQLKGKRVTEWVMKEYRLADEEGGGGNLGPRSVVCRVYRKGRSRPASTAKDLGPTGGDLAAGKEEQETNTTIVSELSSSKPNYLATSPSAPGFGFHPTGVELVNYYLKHKISGLSFHVDAIVEVDLYKWSPWDLTSLYRSSSGSHDLESYFFCSVVSYVSHRLSPQGFWKSSGYDRPIYHATKIIGARKTLVFYAGRNPSGQKTNWIMHEYRLDDGQSNSTSFGSSFVICKIFLQKERAPRRRRAQSGSSFIEEQVEAEQDLVLSGEASITPEVSKENAQEQDHMDTEDFEQDKAVNLPHLEGRTSTSHINLVHASNIAHKYKEPDLIALSIGCGDETLCAVPISATNSENDNSERLTFQRELELQPCRQAENGESMEDNTKLSSVRGTETSSASKTGFDVCTPVINEEPIVHIKSLVVKWRAEFKKADASVVDIITQPSPDILRPRESIQQAVLLQNNEQRRELTHEHQSRGDEVAIENITGEKRRKDDGPQNLRIDDDSLEGDSRRNQQDNVVDMPTIEGLSRSTPKSGTCSLNSQEAEDQSNVSELQIEEDENGVILSTTGENISKKARTEKSTNASEPCLDELPPKQSQLPFDKCSPMWNSIETLEIFRILPQQPHFRPLETYNKEFREGMAIGLMVTFSNLVKSISKLLIDDPHHTFDEILKTLVQLEQHGFTVHCIRARIIELLRMKKNRERLVDVGSKLEVLLAKNKRKKEQLHANFEPVEKAARVLEVSLSHFYEARDYILERKRESESEFDKVEMDSRTVEEALRSSKNDFEATLSAAW